MRDSGRMEISTDRENTNLKEMINGRLDVGKTAKDSSE